MKYLGIISLSVLLFTGCGSESDCSTSPLIGTWAVEMPDSVELAGDSLTFNNNCTFKINGGCGIFGDFYMNDDDNLVWITRGKESNDGSCDYEIDGTLITQTYEIIDENTLFLDWPED